MNALYLRLLLLPLLPQCCYYCNFSFSKKKSKQIANPRLFPLYSGPQFYIPSYNFVNEIARFPTYFKFFWVF